MGANTKIEWCDHTFSPWRGCQKVAAGCANCYAESQAKRNTGTLGKWGPNGTRVVAAESAWKQVEKWDRVARGVPPHGWPTPDGTASVFCGSMCDVFEDWLGGAIDAHGNSIYLTRDGAFDSKYSDKEGHREIVALPHVRQRLFRLIDATRLTWLLLTKRPENIRRFWPSECTSPAHAVPCRNNVWLGTSIACQEDAERNIPELLKCRDLCAGLFLSIEPLIGPVDLSLDSYESPGFYEYRSNLIDQVIIGGESGPNARPCDIDWIRSIASQCEAAGVLCMVKQIGSNPVGLRFSIDDNGSPFCIENDSFRGGAKPLDKKGGDLAEWPEDLRQYRKLAWKGGA